MDVVIRNVYAQIISSEEKIGMIVPYANILIEWIDSG